MSGSTKLPEPPPSVAVTTGHSISRGLLVCVTFVALVIGGYLSYKKLTGQISSLVGCGGEEGCSSLLGSRWSNWFLLPVSLWSAVVYAPLFATAVAGLNTPRRRRLAVVASTILVSAAAWFMVVQGVIEGQFCKYCCAMHLCSLISFLCVAMLTMAYPPQENLRHLAMAIPVAMLAVTALAAGQLWGPQVASYEITQDDFFAGETPIETTFDIGPLDADRASTSDAVAPVAAPDAARPEPLTPDDGAAPQTSLPRPHGPRPLNPEFLPGDRLLARRRSLAPVATDDGTPGDAGHAARWLRQTLALTQPRVPAARSRVLARADAADDQELPNFDETPAQTPRSTDSEKPSTATAPSPPADAKADAVPTDAAPAKPTAADPSTDKSGRRVVSYFGGVIKYSVGELPMLGKPTAPHVFVKYFDYTCPSCKRMHEELAKALTQYPDELAVIVVPCPLEHRCNPHSVTSLVAGKDPHEGACELATLSLAVWRADRTKFIRFHEELFERQGKMTPEAARVIAQAAVGKDALARAEADEWIRQVMRASIAIYGKMGARNPKMPKLLLGERRVMHGVAADAATFEKMIRDEVKR